MKIQITHFDSAGRMLEITEREIGSFAPAGTTELRPDLTNFHPDQLDLDDFCCGLTIRDEAGIRVLQEWTWEYDPEADNGAWKRV